VLQTRATTRRSKQARTRRTRVEIMFDSACWEEDEAKNKASCRPSFMLMHYAVVGYDEKYA
jgi:hypothetical protein